MPKLRNVKPTMKSEWRGMTGNKFRIYIVINSRGNRYVFKNKADALRLFNASKRVYLIPLKEYI
jgi:hypothetical protein